MNTQARERMAEKSSCFVPFTVLHISCVWDINHMFSVLIYLGTGVSPNIDYYLFLN